MIDARIDIDHLQGWIGKEIAAEEVLTAALAEKFHATLELPGAAPREGEPAARLIHFCLCQPVAANSILGVDGHPQRGSFLPPIPLPRRMWAAGDLRFSGDLLVGQTVCRHSRVFDVTFKTGKSGSLCFVTVDHRIEADGILRVEERQTIVYRGEQPAGGQTAENAPPAPEGDLTVSLVPTPMLLFRYSALTFNAHRIHYDRPYATGEESYPGLVVQGPLQATFLFHFAAAINGASPDRFAFRGISPLYDLDEIYLHAGPHETGCREFWTARAGGPVAMCAEAFWS